MFNNGPTNPQVGVSALFGFAVFFCMIPLQTVFARRFGTLRKQMVALRDERIRKLSDMLQGIQVRPRLEPFSLAFLAPP